MSTTKFPFPKPASAARRVLGKEINTLLPPMTQVKEQKQIDVWSAVKRFSGEKVVDTLGLPRDAAKRGYTAVVKKVEIPHLPMAVDTSEATEYIKKLGLGAPDSLRYKGEVTEIRDPKGNVVGTSENLSIEYNRGDYGGTAPIGVFEAGREGRVIGIKEPFYNGGWEITEETATRSYDKFELRDGEMVAVKKVTIKVDLDTNEKTTRERPLK